MIYEPVIYIYAQMSDAMERLANFLQQNRAETLNVGEAERRKNQITLTADGFYEWRKTAKPKLPFAIAMKDGRPFTFAGLWDEWKGPESGEWLRTCTIITGEPNELVAQIHPRMPVILPEQHHAAWFANSLVKGNRERKLKRVAGPLPCRPDANVGNFSAGK